MKNKVIKNIKLIGLLLLSFLLLVSLGCKNKEAKKIRKKALNYLQKTYNKKFIIQDTRFIRQNKVWELTAAPKDNKEIDFKIRTEGIYGKSFYEHYPKTKLSIESIEYYKPILRNIFGRKMYFYSNLTTRAKINKKNIPSVSKLLQKHPDSTYVNIFIHIFENVVSPPERKQKFLKNVMELLEYMRGQNLKWGTITVRIYDEEFYKDKDIDYILEETNFFHKGSRKLDYNAMEYESYMKYGLGINNKDFFEIETIEDLEEELNKANLKFQRE